MKTGGLPKAKALCCAWAVVDYMDMQIGELEINNVANHTFFVKKVYILTNIKYYVSLE